MIADLHNDIITSGLSQDKIAKYIFSEAVKNNVSLITLAVFTTKLKKSAKEILMMTDPFVALYTHVRTHFSIEDASFLGHSEWRLLDLFRIHSATLTWNYDNKLAGGAHGQSGLTKQGKKMIAFFEEKKILLDLAHLNKKSFYDCLNVCKKPLICSHTCFDDVCKHERNIDGQQIREILDRGGFIGLALVGQFLSNKPATLDDIVKHIDYFVQKFGVDGLGIGTDFYGTEDLPHGISEYSHFGVLFDRLVQLGYDNKSINKIFGENYLAFLDKNKG